MRKFRVKYLRLFRIAEEPRKIWPSCLLHRFDFPSEMGISTIYFGESEKASFVELLAQFRPKITDEVLALPGDDEPPNSNIVPMSWINRRCIGSIEIQQRAKIFDVTKIRNITILRKDEFLKRSAAGLGFSDIDEASLKASGNRGRKLTQNVSKHIFDINFCGIRYGSRLDGTLACIALFIRTDLKNLEKSDLF